MSITTSTPPGTALAPLSFELPLVGETVREQLVDLLAMIIADPNARDKARELLAYFSEPTLLLSAHEDELIEAGLSIKEAQRVQASIRISQRLMEGQAEQTTIKGPRDCANLLIPRMGHLEQEHLIVLLLTAKSAVIDIITIHQGTLSSSLVRPAEVFRPAIRRNAARIIVAHNHPSNDPEPSPDDVSITRDLIQAGEALDLPVLDHLIITATSYISLKERRLGF